MEDKQQASSGLATPPLVSPRSIQTERRSSAEDTTWKVVGSPPRKALLSPPEKDRTRPQTLDLRHPHDIDGPVASNAPETNSRESAFSPASVTSTPATTTESATATTATAASVAPPTPQLNPDAPQLATLEDSHKQHVESPIHTPTTPSPSTQSLTGFASPSRLEGLLGSLAPTLPAICAITATSRPQDLSFGPLDIITGGNNNNSSNSIGSKNQRVGNTLFHSTSAISNESTALPARAAGGLESPLSMSSFAWNGHVADGGVRPMATLASTLGALTTGMRQESGIGGGNLFSMSSVLNADPFVPTHYRPSRSFSLSEPPGFSTGFGSNSSRMASFDVDNDGLGSFRLPLPTMEEEAEDAFEARASRTRSYSTSAAFGSGAFYGGLSNSALPTRDRQSSFLPPTTSLSTDPMGLLGQDHHPFVNRKISGGSTWPSISQHSTAHNRPSVVPTHRRSLTSGNYMSQASPVWEASNAFLPASQQAVAEREPSESAFGFQGRRFSLAQGSDFKTYDQFVEREQLLGSSAASGYDSYSEYVHPQRRHSVAGPSGSYYRPSSNGAAAGPYNLTSSLESLQLDEAEQNSVWNLKDGYDRDDYQYSNNSSINSSQLTSTNDLGKGLTLSQLSHLGSLYVVEFKAGRSDLFYVADNSVSYTNGDLVMVEADRGKDLGKITNDSITPQQIQEMQKHHAEAAAAAQQEGARAPKEIHPKRIFRMAQPSEIAELVMKSQDEISAMKVCQSKVRQKKLPMEVVDAEFQWDRRKLTFYFQAEHRIDFRELVRDLFKTYKTRIWMYAVNGSLPAGATRESGGQSSPPRGVTSPSVSPSSSQPPRHSMHSYVPQEHSYHPQSQHHHHQQHHHQGHRQHELHHHPSGQYHPPQPQHQPQLQELVRQVQSHYFSAGPQPSPSLFQTGFQGQMHLMEEEELLQAQGPPFFEQLRLQSPHPLS
ncbi:hypothetical protein BGX28_008452 [Mortierella sp. GBA30]|nr:hypothetical protein BGX28_008452 [Mortierella sp. GBA30]